ncbi:hypothetical protein [Peribacillus butanolivorans]
MKTEYLAKELCEHHFNEIDEKTFRRNKKKYMNALDEKGFDVEEGKRGRFTTYLLDSRERKLTAQQVDDAKFLEIIGCNIGGKDITLFKFILKSLIERKIVPGHVELTHHANLAGIKLKRTSITNYMGFLKEHDIIVAPMKVPVWDNNPLIKRVVDKETGEILPTCYKKICNRIYFDFAKDGSSFERERLSKNTQKAIEMAYYNLLPEMMESKIYPLYAKGHSDKYINNERMKAQSQLLREIGTAYGVDYCVRMDEPIINSAIKRQLKEYFGKEISA